MSVWTPVMYLSNWQLSKCNSLRFDRLSVQYTAWCQYIKQVQSVRYSIHSSYAYQDKISETFKGNYFLFFRNSTIVFILIIDNLKTCSYLQNYHNQIKLTTCVYRTRDDIVCVLCTVTFEYRKKCQKFRHLICIVIICLICVMEIIRNVDLCFSVITKYEISIK